MFNYNNKYNKAYYILVVIFFLGFLVQMIYQEYNGYKKNFDKTFNGRVEKIRYDVKHFPYITIDKKEYYIGSIWENRDVIDTGDFAEKKKGELMITVTKKDNSIIILRTR